MGTMMSVSLFHQPQLSSSAASSTSEGSECSAARQTTMLKPAHFQAWVTISEPSANRGSPSQACAQLSSPMARSMPGVLVMT
ncbi:hypothetical protein D9M68_852110 [compost metagenome]